MTPLLKRTQIDGVVCLARNLKPERISIKGPRLHEIGDAILDMTEANDIEWWI